MQMMEVSPGVVAFVRPTEGANASLIRTGEGIVIVDTTSCAADMMGLLDVARASPAEACLAINTHQHSDHTWGNQLFDCPIVAHRLCREAMELFVGLYGAEAGNLSLKQMARGGLFIGGGIAPRILPWLTAGPFIEAFRAKGRMRPLMESMPVKVILNDRAALLGPARFLAR